MLKYKFIIFRYIKINGIDSFIVQIRYVNSEKDQQFLTLIKLKTPKIKWIKNNDSISYKVFLQF